MGLLRLQLPPRTGQGLSFLSWARGCWVTTEVPGPGSVFCSLTGPGERGAVRASVRRCQQPALEDLGLAGALCTGSLAKGSGQAPQAEGRWPGRLTTTITVAEESEALPGPSQGPATAQGQGPRGVPNRAWLGFQSR